MKDEVKKALKIAKLGKTEGKVQMRKKQKASATLGKTE